MSKLLSIAETQKQPLKREKCEIKIIARMIWLLEKEKLGVIRITPIF
jgi:hypothetical protein